MKSIANWHEKTAAARIGVTTEEYLSRIALGEKWCTRCKAWHSRQIFHIDRSRPELLRTPAALRFVSYEPALAEVNFIPFLDPVSFSIGLGIRRGLDWGIIGGESGPGARPFDIEWARNTIRQFKAAGVPLFVKQLGVDPRSRICETWPIETKWRSGVSPFGMVPLLKDSKGGDWSEWPEDLRVREFPCTK